MQAHAHVIAVDSMMSDPVALRAAQAALVQRRRGARQSARELYYGAFSLLRTLRSHLLGADN